MARRVIVMLSLSCGLALATIAQTQESSPPRPSVINSTYVVTASSGETYGIRLQEEDGQLIINEKWLKHDWPESTESVKYEKVNYVLIEGDSPASDAPKRTVQIEDSKGHYLIVTLPTEMDAKTVAEYVVRKSPLHLEFIAGAWRVRKPFECPEAGQPGCQDFKELLDHDDPDIGESFYERDENAHVYACFSNEEKRFFVVRYTHYHSGKLGAFSLVAFSNGQMTLTDFRLVDWSLGDTGSITEKKQGQKPQTLGWIDSSSLTYQNKFINKMKTTTQHELSIRWSTGRYSESLSGKDDKGEQFNTDSSGICVKLH
jgi:hypothetical protein